ncbi:LRR receptor-like serine/threonine-protein kinase FEI 1 [Zea mays]|uniref:LRR receptor-like serine/threonine-protein kinase FEI 1 n=1 Tax=Zea mays TaxID=4577 RepID=A0A1D6JXI7_MAIZE|nr:LRR receptor-like serine/threonine-protein kinase FEI 1 [Zea mays]
MCLQGRGRAVKGTVGCRFVGVRDGSCPMFICLGEGHGPLHVLWVLDLLHVILKCCSLRVSARPTCARKRFVCSLTMMVFRRGTSWESGLHWLGGLKRLLRQVKYAKSFTLSCVRHMYHCWAPPVR